MVHLVQLIVVMASHCYLVGPTGELFVEYLVRHSAISDEEIHDFDRSNDVTRTSGAFQPFQYKKLEVLPQTLKWCIAAKINPIILPLLLELFVNFQMVYSSQFFSR